MDQLATDREAREAWLRAEVDVLTSKLARAERAVGHACTETAAVAAHRLADHLLLELEAAEDGLRAAEQQGSHASTGAPKRMLRAHKAQEQGQLFDMA